MTLESRFKRGWMLANGLGWLVATGILTVYLLLINDWDPWELIGYVFEELDFYQVVQVMVWIFGLVVSAAQWAALRQIRQLANRWLIASLVGSLIGGLLIYVLKWLLGLFDIFFTSVISESTSAMLLILYGIFFATPIILAHLISPLILSGLVTGLMLTGVLRRMYPAEKAWWFIHTLGIVAGAGLLPLGGLLYGWITLPKLSKILFSAEKEASDD